MNQNGMSKGLMLLGGKCAEFYDANKAHIFTGIGIGGTVLTGILAAQSGARSARKIDRKEAELGRRLSYIEKGKLCWTDAIPPVLTCAAACYSEWKSDRLFTADISKRTAMLIASEKAYEKLSQKTREVLGDKKAKQVQDSVVSDQITEARQNGIISMDAWATAPRVGNGQLYMFVDKYTMLPFWSNWDYIKLQVVEMQNMMAELAPRGSAFDYDGKEVGVYYSEWLNRIGYVDKRITRSEERRHIGWNKGFAADGSHDDVIDYVTTAYEWEPGVAVTAICWTTDPSDMRMGRMKKSNEI